MILQPDLFLDAPVRLAWARDHLICEAWPRFVSKLHAPDPFACWCWCGATRRGGGKPETSPVYGAFWFDGGMRIAHVFAAVAAGLEWPLGFTLDHTCFNTLCVNPLHLEPVTRAENTRRGFVSRCGRRSLAA